MRGVAGVGFESLNLVMQIGSEGKLPTNKTLGSAGMSNKVMEIWKKQPKNQVNIEPLE